MPDIMNRTRLVEMITIHCKRNIQQPKFSKMIRDEII